MSKSIRRVFVESRGALITFLRDLGVSDPELGRDLIQQAYLRCRGRLDMNRNPFAYVCQCLRFQYYNHRAHQEVRCRYAETVSIDESTEYVDSRRQKVLDNLNSLPDLHQRLILMVMDGRDRSELSRELDLRGRDIGRHLAMAAEELRAAIAREREEI